MPRLLDRRPRDLLALGLVFFGLVLLGTVQPAAADEPDGGEGSSRPEVSHDGWPDHILDVVAEIPVQHVGRVKPLLTYARFTLLRINGYPQFRKNKGKDDERVIGPVEWLLDVMFFPEVATAYPCIRVADWGALIDVGLENVTKGKKKSDRYSFEDLYRAGPTIEAKAEAYEHLDPKRRSGVQSQVILLWQNVKEMRDLVTFITFARLPHKVGQSPELKAIFDGRETVRTSEVLSRWGLLVRRFDELTRDAKEESVLTGEALAIRDLLRGAMAPLSASTALRIIPPVGPVGNTEDWFTPSVLPRLDDIPDDMAAIVADFERMHDARENKSAFLGAVEELRARTRKMAETRDEFGTIPLEVTLYSFDPFFKAKLCFLLAFVVIAFSWIWSKSKWLRWAGFGFLIAGVLLATYGITLRCLIRGRPPVTNLYETVLFITVFGVLACVLTEWINKQRIAFALAPIVGVLGLFVAESYEALEMKDTMTGLVAVLRSNFWLWTHVTVIAIGYCAGLLAGFLGCIYVLARAFDIKPRSPRFFTSLTRMTYGMVAFGLLFSLIGTILGGIWANDSWGRFWGWDPKENGALMIVIWSLIILHSRVAGYIGPFGVAMASIFGGCIVAFSWWGVNLLGIGLHTYGFTEGIFNGLMIFFATQGAAMLTGFYWHFLIRGRASNAAA